jgi:hypothetical protein
MQPRVIGLHAVIATLILSVVILAQTPLDEHFTYQGLIKNNGSPVNGPCDFIFALFDVPLSGSPLGPPFATSAAVTNGVFTVHLEFAPGVFNGGKRWLDVQSRCPAGSGSYIALSPRQEITAAPHAAYALQAGTAASAPWSGIAGVPSNLLTQVSHDATLTGTGNSGSPLGLADSSVSTAKLQDNAVTLEKIADNSVGGYKIIAGAVGPQQLADGAVRQQHLAAATPTAGQVLSYNGTNLQWVDQTAPAEPNNGKTRLLYPYVCNHNGFDTSIGIMNTGADPFGTVGATGTATVYYYGSMGTGALPSPQTTAPIAPGQLVGFSLIGGGVPSSSSSATTFCGYVIVVCNFPLGHGFYMIYDPGLTTYATSGEAIVLSSTRDASRVESRGK